MTTTRQAGTLTKQRWVAEPGRSTVDFTVGHFWGLASVTGHFDRFAGTYAVGPDGPRIELEVDADSLNIGNGVRDRHLRASDFFDVEKYPHVRFTSTRVVERGDGTAHVDGEVEAVGRKLPVAFDATIREADGALELETTTTVEPRRLGMSTAFGSIRSPATVHVKVRLV